MISMPTLGPVMSISISCSSIVPSRNFLRNICRAAESSRSDGSFSKLLAGGSNASNILSSAASSALIFTFSCSCSRSILNDESTKSRIIESTSRPTYPTSVNLVASIFINGALASLAKRRAISVFPTPVGPIIKIFFGVISFRKSSLTCIRRQRFLKAIATDFLASFCPMICLSNS